MITECASFERFAIGRDIFREGGEADRLCILHKGRVPLGAQGSIVSRSRRAQAEHDFVKACERLLLDPQFPKKPGFDNTREACLFLRLYFPKRKRILMATSMHPSKARAPSRATTLAVPRATGGSKKTERPSKVAGGFIKWFGDITIDDVPLVGGKNASLGELYRELGSKGVKVPDGFVYDG